MKTLLLLLLLLLNIVNFHIFTLTGFLDLCGSGDYAYRFWMRDRFVRLHIFSAFSHYLWLCLDFEIRGSWRVFRRQTKCYQYIAPTPQASVNPIGSLNSDDSDGSENGKKNKKNKKNSRFRLTKQTTLHVHHPFLYVVWNNVPIFHVLSRAGTQNNNFLVLLLNFDTIL